MKEELKINKPEDVERAKKAMLKDEAYAKLELFFKNFGDLTRLRIMTLLLETELCVQDIASALDMTQSAISHQIRILKSSGVVKGTRDGKLIYYSLDDDHVKKVLAFGIDHISHLL